jgi:tripartite-type tricarboxylate transporter receptor subunit TctC
MFCKKMSLSMLLLILIFGFAAAAQAEYPHKTVILITHSSPGGGSDLFLRNAVKFLGPQMGVNFVVKNVRGGSGAKAMARLVDSPADGTYFYASTPTFLMTPLVGKTKYTYRNLEPMVNVFLDPMVAYTRADSPFNTLTEAVAYAKKNPGKGKWGGANPTSLERQILEGLKYVSGIKEVAVVSFEGGGDLMLSVLGGTLDFGIGEPGEIGSQIEAGKLKMLATFTADRLAVFPDVPTAREQGLDIVKTKFRGLTGPQGLPRNVVQAWEKAIPQLLANPEYKAQYEKDALVPAFMDQKTFAPYIAERSADIEAYLKSMGVIK